MESDADNGGSAADVGALRRWDGICDEFEASWTNGRQPDCRMFLGKVAAEERAALLAYLLPIELEWKQASFSPVTLDGLLRAYPEYPEAVMAAWESHLERERVDARSGSERRVAAELLSGPDGSGLASGASGVSMPVLVEKVGRYVVLKELGRGGFAVVYLAHDPDLGREVALKIPRPDKDWSPRDLHDFAAEARRTVGLKGTGILTIHDLLACEIMGKPSVCLVQEYLKGDSLQRWMAGRAGPVEHDFAAGLVAQVATILQTAHSQGFIHRDIKPDNILLDADCHPHLLDFGLALHVNERTRDEQRMAGSLPYMAPEQIRGETHRFEPATDIWSLGVVLYQLLTGARPFANASRKRLCSAIKYVDPAPPGRLAPHCPAELERICLKCLAKPIGDRYRSAAELASDLWQWRDADSVDNLPRPDRVGDSASTKARERGDRSDRNSAVGGLLAGSDAAGSGVAGSGDAGSGVAGSGSPTYGSQGGLDVAGLAASSSGSRFEPKGLAAFEATDAAAYLTLLPGPRGRDQLPESIRFWKQRLEEEAGFAVGMLYGPSGSGKSSFFKAGVLPRLDRRLVTVIIESTAQDMESRLLAALRAQVPALPVGVTLVEAFEGLREGRWGGEGPRVVIVLDQFEQWLHGNRSELTGALSEALRQCDGRRLRVVLLVRDDFWTPVTEFLRVLEVRSVDGYNVAEWPLFDPTHARKVLATLGAAYGRLPADFALLDATQEAFLESAVGELVESGKVDGVRLSLLAEMMKNSPWTKDRLRELGGLRGLGMLFLERALGDGAPAERQPQVAAAIGCLAALLPSVGGSSRGRRRSTLELAVAAGLERQSAEFQSLMELLGKRLRLIMPVDDQGPDPAFQLTHEYLVPSLRAWIRHKKYDSASGRAALRLEERCAAWNEWPENRQLPTLFESLRIAVLTSAKSWSGDERRMMRRAARVHATRVSLLCTLMAVLIASGWGAFTYVAASDASNLRNNIREAVATLEMSDGERIPAALRNLERYPADLVQLELEQRLAGREGSPARLALLFGQARFGRPQFAELIQESANAPGWEGANFVRALLPHREQALEALRREFGLIESASQSHPKARLAILAFCFGDSSLAESLAQLTPDPSWRTSLIAQFGEFQALAAMPAEVIERSRDAALRSAICLGIGAMANPSPPDELRTGWAKRIEAWHAASPSGLLHSASRWALSQWRVLPKSEPTRDGPTSERDWFVNSCGLTFLRIPAGSTTYKDREYFQTLAATAKQLRDINDPSFSEAPDDDEFWMSDSEVPSTAFYTFYKDPDVPAADRLTRSMLSLESPDNSPTPYPMREITFADAVLFCNWLSLREGRKPCYERTGRMLPQDGARAADLWRVVPQANGYRLPWASEWIRACRGGTLTEYAFGNHNQRLRDYGVFLDNSGGEVARVRSRRCNAWGLFDLHGNVFEWCNDRTDPDKFRYIVQGGCFSSAAGDCAAQPTRKESARRGAATRSPLVGMRLVIRP